MKARLKDPLLHFAAGGALLFAAYAWLSPAPPPSDARQIRIGAAEVKWLDATWRGQTGRAPTAEELRELIANLVKEELLSREARELRLDENDTIVRRRLAQKLEFMLQDMARIAAPSDEELRRFHAASPGLFLTETRVSFSHRFVGEGKAPRLLEAEFRDADLQSVAAAFGPQFARAVFELQPGGGWRGPIESGYGAHLVQVTALEPAKPRSFDEVRPLLVEHWREAKQREAQARYIERLMGKYQVILEPGVQK